MTCDMSPGLIASAGHIDVWLAYYRDIVDPKLHTRYRAMMTEQERGQELRFYFADDRLRFMVTRALVRSVLSKYAAVRPEDWIFEANRYGRPFVTNRAAQECGLRFNISHTHGLIALGVTAQRELGVDVECVGTREVSMGIAHRFFAPLEVADLATIAPELQQERFLEYWTFKESYIKARGMGLSIALDQFSFHYPHTRGVRIAVQPELDDASCWTFLQYRPNTKYFLAVCIERLGAEWPTVTLRKIVPMVAEEIVEEELTRCSSRRGAEFDTWQGGE